MEPESPQKAKAILRTTLEVSEQSKSPYVNPCLCDQLLYNKDKNI